MACARRPRSWPGVRVLDLAVADLGDLGHQVAEQGAHLALDAVHLLLARGGRILLGLGGDAFAAELLGVDDDALDAGRDFERFVLHVFAGLAEDGDEEFLLRRQLGLGLRRDLADEDVAGPHVGADADDAFLIEVRQRALGHVGNVAGELLLAQLGLAAFDLELLDVDRGEAVRLDEALAHQDGVLEVVAVPGHEGDEGVLAERQFALGGAGAVGDDLALLDLLAGAHERASG